MAAERFDENAALFATSLAQFNALTPEEQTAHLEVKRIDGRVILNPNPRAFSPLIEQFELQARETRDLIEFMDGPDDADDVAIIVAVTID